MSYLKHKPGSIEELMANEATKLNDNAYQQMFKKELDKADSEFDSWFEKTLVEAGLAKEYEGQLTDFFFDEPTRLVALLH